MIYKVTNDIYRGPMPDFEELKANHIRCILNLETQTQELLFGDPNWEIKKCSEYEITMYDMALSGLLPPKKDDLLLATAILARSVKRPIYVHCRHGRERTGIVVAAFRKLYMGWSTDDAWIEMLQMGCRFPYSLMVKDLLRSL